MHARDLHRLDVARRRGEQGGAHGAGWRSRSTTAKPASERIGRSQGADSASMSNAPRLGQAVGVGLQDGVTRRWWRHAAIVPVTLQAAIAFDDRCRGRDARGRLPTGQCRFRRRTEMALSLDQSNRHHRRRPRCAPPEAGYKPMAVVVLRQRGTSGAPSGRTAPACFASTSPPARRGRRSPWARPRGADAACQGPAGVLRRACRDRQRQVHPADRRVLISSLMAA